MNIDKALQQLKVTGILLPIAGGEVNQTFKVITDEKIYFLKAHPGVEERFFVAEAGGLKQLAPFVRVPEIYQIAENDEGAFLLMEWIEQKEGQQERIAEQLAYLHQQTHPVFGFSEDNFIGMLPQVNAQTANWTDFFLACRLDTQVELAKMNNVWNAKRDQKYLRLKSFIREAWQDRKVQPSLVHGDFWRGNVFFDQSGVPVFIDPAVFYGDREMDIAMSQLFGGFRQSFLERYQEIFPMESGWQERMPFYQLYYLLVHLNQFGKSYGKNVDEILVRF